MTPRGHVHTVQLEAVDELMKYAARQCENLGVPFKPSQASKLIRSELRSGTEDVRRVIDAWIDQAAERSYWSQYELRTSTGVVDPTAATAIANIEREKAVTALRAA